MSEAHVIYFFTHDSIGLGQDGPTHQPIEQLASLAGHAGSSRDPPRRRQRDRRRLADRSRLGRPDGPGAEPPGPPGARRDELARKRGSGPWRLCPRGRARRRPGPDVVLIGTGSEVQHCLGAAELLRAEGVTARVVSFPSWDLFAEQEAGYRDGVLATGRSASRGRGRIFVRLGALRGRHGHHRPLRCLGAGVGEHGEVRIHRR